MIKLVLEAVRGRDFVKRGSHQPLQTKRLPDAAPRQSEGRDVRGVDVDVERRKKDARQRGSLDLICRSLASSLFVDGRLWGGVTADAAAGARANSRRYAGEEDRVKRATKSR